MATEGDMRTKLNHHTKLKKTVNELKYSQSNLNIKYLEHENKDKINEET